MPDRISRATDHRRRNLAQLHEDVVFGRSGGQIIWQPRIQCWLTDHRFYGIPFPEGYEGLSHDEVYRKLGCSDRPYNRYNPCFPAVEPASVRTTQEWVDETHLREEIHTPVGSVSTIQRKSPNSYRRYYEKRFIETPEDMRVFTWLYDNSTWRFDAELFASTLADIGDLAAPTMYLPRVTVQDLYINKMGVEHTVYALYEWDNVITDYFRAMNDNHLRLVDAVNASPVQIINFGDNLHCSTLSPALFEEYVLPAYLERCDRLHQGGKFVSSHWDGDTRALLPYAKTCGLDGIEAITPHPQGDVTLEEIQDALGDEIFLLDGIPAILFDDLYPEEELIATVERIIALFAPKLVLGISDELSSTGNIDRVALVGKMVDDYNATVG